MGNFGVGLGSFMQGLQGGMSVRNEMDDRKRKKILDARQDKEYQRELDQRDRLDAIGVGAKQEFDKQVDAGTAKVDDFDNFFQTYAIPKMRNEMLINGDVDGAEKLAKWGESADAKRGAKLFSSALVKAQTGDNFGALTDALDAAKIKGYIHHDFTAGDIAELKTPDGKLMGYRLNFKTAGGEDKYQDVTPDQIPQIISTFANPEMAFKTQVDAAAAARKKKDELEQYEQKKRIDKRYTGTGKSRSDAISSLRKRLDGGIAGDEPKFDDLPADQKEKLIADELALQGGDSAVGLGRGDNSAPASRKVLVDRETGQLVQPAADESRDEVGRRNVQSAMREQERQLEERRAAQAAASQEQQQASDLQAKQAEMARVRVENGENPNAVAADLTSIGVPQDLWPEALRRQ